MNSVCNATSWFLPQTFVAQGPFPPVDRPHLESVLNKFRQDHPHHTSYLGRWAGIKNLKIHDQEVKLRDSVIVVFASTHDPLRELGFFEDVPVLVLTESKASREQFSLGFGINTQSSWKLVPFNHQRFSEVEAFALTLRDYLKDCYFVLPMTDYRNEEIMLFTVIPHKCVRPIEEDYCLPRFWNGYQVHYVNEVFVKDMVFVYPRLDEFFQFQKFIGVPMEVVCPGSNIGVEHERQLGGTLALFVNNNECPSLITAAHVVSWSTSPQCEVFQPSSDAFQHYKNNLELKGEAPSPVEMQRIVSETFLGPSSGSIPYETISENVNIIEGYVQYSESEESYLDVAILKVLSDVRITNEFCLPPSEWEEKGRIAVRCNCAEERYETVFDVAKRFTGREQPFPIRIVGLQEDNFLQDYWNLKGHVSFPVFKVGAATGLTFGAILYESVPSPIRSPVAEVNIWRGTKMLAVVPYGPGKFADHCDSGAAVLDFNGRVVGIISQISDTVTGVISIESIRRVWPNISVL
ncbi:hypothetical protein RCL1_000975 [Eukaryota sp. TZLM3-RCL]